jgi:hypothetical protein
MTNSPSRAVIGASASHRPDGFKNTAAITCEHQRVRPPILRIGLAFDQAPSLKLIYEANHSAGNASVT